MNSTPRVPGPQWDVTVEPAVVSMISSKSGASSRIFCRTASTASGAQRVWVMNTRCLLMSSRPRRRSSAYCSITLSMGPRYFLPGVILPSFTSMQGFSFSRFPPKALRAEQRPPLYR